MVVSGRLGVAIYVRSEVCDVVNDMIVIQGQAALRYKCCNE